jgi:hypothetical protein
MATKRHRAGKGGSVHRVAEFKYKPGATVYMKRHPGVPFVVLKSMTAFASGDPTYTVRAADNVSDTRGYLVWEDALT